MSEEVSERQRQRRRDRETECSTGAKNHVDLMSDFLQSAFHTKQGCNTLTNPKFICLYNPHVHMFFVSTNNDPTKTDGAAGRLRLGACTHLYEYVHTQTRLAENKNGSNCAYYCRLHVLGNSIISVVTKNIASFFFFFFFF